MILLFSIILFSQTKNNFTNKIILKNAFGLQKLKNRISFHAFLVYMKSYFFDTRAGNSFLGPWREIAKMIDPTIDDESV